MRMLIVEDEALLALNTQLELAGMGHEVVGIADSAEAALKLAAEERPDLILMDIVLQGDVNGIDLAREICRMHPGIKIIFMSAHSDGQTIRSANGISHLGFLNKPFEAYQIEGLLMRALEEREGAQ